jgi:membrane-anchored protein YejM (alkaline phosphatase superfamily)
VSIKKIYKYSFGIFIMALMIVIPITYITGSTKMVQGVVVGGCALTTQQVRFIDFIFTVY